MRVLVNPSSVSPVLADLALLVARVLLGVVLIAHGWQKFHEWTVAGTAESFAGMGVPMASAAAAVATWVELIGGAMLVVGLLTPLAALLGAAVMLGATFFVHLPNGLFVDQGGAELVLALFAGLLVLAVRGGGRFGLDAALSRSGVRQPVAAR